MQGHSRAAFPQDPQSPVVNSTLIPFSKGIVDPPLRGPGKVQVQLLPRPSGAPGGHTARALRGAASEAKFPQKAGNGTWELLFPQPLRALPQALFWGFPWRAKQSLSKGLLVQSCVLGTREPCATSLPHFPSSPGHRSSTSCVHTYILLLLVSAADNSKDLATELVHYGFIHEVSPCCPQAWSHCRATRAPPAPAPHRQGLVFCSLRTLLQELFQGELPVVAHVTELHLK